MTFVGLDGALDTSLFVMADEVSRRPRDALSRKALEDVGNHDRDGGLVMRLQLVLVLRLQQFFLHVEVEIDFLVTLELHHQEGIPGLTLSQRGIQTNGNKSVHIVRLRQNHELLDGVELNLVVIRFAA